MERETVFIDLDGVLTDFTRGYRAWYGLDFRYEQACDWNFCHRVFKRQTGKSKDAFWRGFTKEFWANLEKTPECDMILALVEPYNPIVLTAPPIDPSGEAVGGKMIWIRNNLSKYFHEGRYLIGPAKKSIAREGALLIDDLGANCEEWSSAGGDSILVPRPWNVLSGSDPVVVIQEGLMNILREDY